MNTNKKESTIQSQPKKTFAELIKSSGCNPNAIDLSAQGNKESILKVEKSSSKPLHSYSVGGIYNTSMGWFKEVPGKDVRVYFETSEECAKFWAIAEENGLTYDEACRLFIEEMKGAQ